MFFLMDLAEDRGDFGTETQAVKWVTLDEAAPFIEQTKSQRGRARDLRVLALVREMVSGE